MPKIINLSREIKKQLPAEVVSFMQLAGEAAQSHGWSLYLVGGVVRDLLLRRTNLDIDLVVEGNAIALAQELAQANKRTVTAHQRFGTAKLQWDNWSIDLSTARSETYAKPGALPSVKPGSLSSDLFRRDFTINAMAIYLTPGHHGELIDLYSGRDDLEHGLIRILHENSFIDDATRIWRCLRYEQRLNFRQETTTSQLLKRDIAMLDTISGDRIWYELECILQEERPEKVLRRAEELNVLQSLHPSLKGNGWLAEKFEEARRLSSPDSPTIGLYLTLLAYPLSAEENEELISRLRLPKTLSQTLRDTNSIKAKLQSLADPELTPSGIYRLLYGHSLAAITASSPACDSPVARQHFLLFLDKLRHIKPATTGNDLKKMGIVPGPRIKEILQLLHDFRLNGKVKSKQDERRLVDTWLTSHKEKQA